MSIHPNARAVLSKLCFPSPIKKYFLNDEWEIDLSNNTNPYLTEFSDYPDVQQNDLKNLYLNRVLPLNAPVVPKNIIPENLLFTVGLMEGIDILLRTFCEPNKDRICLLQPTFSAYEHWGLIHNLEIKKISLSGENFNIFCLEEIVKINPKMVFICNPNNPTGTSVKLENIQTLCKSIAGFVVVDEAYIEFSDQPSSLPYLNQYSNLIILRTFSKAWGLAGVRCGVIFADPSIIHSLRYVQLPFGFSSPTQNLVQSCLSSPEKAYASWERIKKDRADMIKTLSPLRAVERVLESETNFIMVILKDSRKVMELLKSHRIQVLDCSMSIPHSIRVSIGTEEQNQKFMEVLGKASGAF